jgi:glutamyl-tRNA synthetase
MDDLVEKFDLRRLNPAPAAINFSKLDHFNGLHIRNLDTQELSRRLIPFFKKAGCDPETETMEHITPLIQERMVTLEDGPEKAGFFFESEVHPDPEELIGKNMTAIESISALEQAYQLLSESQDFTHESIEQPLRKLAEMLGLKAGQLFGILRVAVTGQRVSPPLLESMEVIGKPVVLERIQTSILLLKAG